MRGNIPVLTKKEQNRFNFFVRTQGYKQNQSKCVYAQHSSAIKDMLEISNLVLEKLRVPHQ